MNFFFSCDWGTSSFRLRLVDAANTKVLSAINTDYGIAAAFDGCKVSDSGQGVILGSG